MKNGNIVGIDMIHVFNEDGKAIDNIFNFGYNEHDDHAYCDIYDHGIFRVWRDDKKEIIGIDFIRDGKFIELRRKDES